MAFVTTFVSTRTGQNVDAYNIDYSVGPGARGNLPEDIMLVQAIFRIIHFEVRDPLPSPPGATGIDVDGRLGPQTIRFILNAQRIAKSLDFPVLLDGVFDPFRSQGEYSKIAKVRYVFELFCGAAEKSCREQGISNYRDLPKRDDIPSELIAALNGPRRDVARKYENELVH